MPFSYQLTLLYLHVKTFKRKVCLFNSLSPVFLVTVSKTDSFLSTILWWIDRKEEGRKGKEGRKEGRDGGRREESKEYNSVPLHNLTHCKNSKDVEQIYVIEQIN